MKRILFVDDELRILQGLKRMLRGKRGEWDMAFLTDGRQALKLLGEEPYDVLVTDMRMPVMDGAELMEQARQISPATVRIVLSGHSEKSAIMRTVRPAHQYLTKPVDKDILETALDQALKLRDLLADASLTELVNQMESLPALPRVLQELLEEIESQEGSLRRVGKLIARDMGMTTTILKVVNSAFFGLPRKVSDPIQAASLLGMETVKALVLSYQLFSAQSQKRMASFSFEKLWEHSLNTAAFVRSMAQKEGWSQDQVDQAFLAGMLHDVGKLTLMTVASQRYLEVVTRVRQGGVHLCEVEREMLGTSHAEVGAYLLGLWGFRSEVIHAIGLHHRPQATQERTPDLMALIYSANLLEHELVVLHPYYTPPLMNLEYLEASGAIFKWEEWRRLCQEIIAMGVIDGCADSA